MRFNFIFLSLFFVFCINHYVSAQDSIPQNLINNQESAVFNKRINLNKEKIKVSVSSLTDLNLNETPGIVTVITAEDILLKGYNDLLEVLEDITGVSFSSDVQNSVGMNLRGLWAGEAKILVLYDGLPLNDVAYGSFIIGGRIPLNSIAQIEFLKGSGSSLYGNFAGLGVINIISKNTNQSSGGTFNFKTGLSNLYHSETRFDFENNATLLNDIKISLAGSIGTGNRSNMLINNDGHLTNYRDSSRTDNIFMKLNISYNNFEYQLLYDQYAFQGTHERVFSLQENFYNKIAYKKEFKYGIWSSSILNNAQTPWITQFGDPILYSESNTKNNRNELRTDFKSKRLGNFGFNTGLILFQDIYKPYIASFLLLNDEEKLVVNGLAQYVDAYFYSRYFNLFGGYRVDKYYNFSPQISTRFGLTKEFKNWHYKLVAGNSTKIPTLQNINLSFANEENLTPERIYDFQVELGYATKKTNIQVNLFQNQIQNIITFLYDPITFEEGYFNEGYIGVRGFEAFLKHKFNQKIKFEGSVSYYEVFNGESESYLLEDERFQKSTIAVPQWKFVNGLSYKINKHLGLYLSSNILSKRIALDLVDFENQEYDFVVYSPVHLLNFNFNYISKNQLFKMNFGVKNILNTQNVYAFPSTLEYPSIFGRGREFYVSANVKF